jgi:hypothetical protein
MNIETMIDEIVKKTEVETDLFKYVLKINAYP